MDTIKVMCKCGATLQVSTDMAGRLGTCAKCGLTMRIPRELATKVPAAKKITLQPESKPAAAHEEPAIELLAVEWPALYNKAGIMAVVAVIVLGSALGVLFVLPPVENSKTAPKEMLNFYNEATGLKMTFSSDWKIEGPKTGNEIVFVNKRLDAKVVLETGIFMTLNEMGAQYGQEPRAMRGYEIEKESTPNSDKVGTYFELTWNHTPQDSNVKMVTMVRAFYQKDKNKSFTFHVTAFHNEREAAFAEFNEAWNSISFEKGHRISN